MSADNFYNVWQVEGQWYVSQGFASSEDVAYPRPNDTPATSYEEALKGAQDYSEYGYSVDDTNYTWLQILDKAIESAKDRAVQDTLYWFQGSALGVGWKPLPDDLQQAVWTLELGVDNA